MKIARVSAGGRISYALVEGGSLRLIDGDPFSGQGIRPTDTTMNLEGAALLAPCLPTKALCVGLNYRDHAEEMDLPIPSSPVVFMKPASSVIGPCVAIPRPAMSRRVDYEAELAIVIGRRARNVKAADAAACILGYTCANDVTARDLQPKDGQWTISKSFDGFLPLGPWIVTDLDPSALSVRARLAGAVKQSSNTSNLIFPVPYLIEYLSAVMTLEPGDLILTGTPSGVGPMAPGERIEIEIEGIGILANRMS